MSDSDTNHSIDPQEPYMADKAEPVDSLDGHAHNNELSSGVSKIEVKKFII
jgi:hypothetical protein